MHTSKGVMSRTSTQHTLYVLVVTFVIYQVCYASTIERTQSVNIMKEPLSISHEAPKTFGLTHSNQPDKLHAPTHPTYRNWFGKFRSHSRSRFGSDSKSDGFKDMDFKTKQQGRDRAKTVLSAFPSWARNLVEKEDVLLRVLKSNTTGNINKRCAHHLVASVKALIHGRTWAVKMFDAWGKPGPGLAQLYGIFRGEYLECKDVEGPATAVNNVDFPLQKSSVQTAVHFDHNRVDRSDGVKEVETPVFRGKYCHFGISTNELPGQRTRLKVPPIILGLIMDVCVPDSCSAEDVTSLVRSVYETATFHMDPLEIDIEPAECQEKEGWRASTLLVLVLMGLVVSIQKFCTTYDIIFIQRPMWKRQELREKLKANSSDPGTLQSRPADGSRVALLSEEGDESVEEPDGGGAHVTSHQQPTQEIMQVPEPKLTTFQKVAQTFSIYTNSQRLLDTGDDNSTMSCLHGLRVICTAWIVMGDLLIFQMVVVENSADFYFREREKMFTMIIGNYLLAVNAFFVMSGVLVGSSFQQIGDEVSKLKWIGYVVKRYLRLAPLVMIVGALYLGLWPLLGQGPVYPRDAPDRKACESSWFLTTLLVNNYIDFGDICFPWTWYIAAEFQFYLLCPIFMIPLVKGWRKTGILAALTLITGAIVTTGVISKLNKLPEMVVQYELADAGIRNLSDVQNYILIKPYCRMAPYIIGLLLGQTVSTNRAPRLSRVVVALGWLLCIVSEMATIFGVYGSYSHHHLATVNAAAVYNAVKDVTFSLGVAWGIYACLTGNGGFVNTFLSWKVFVPLSRMSYCIYLVHIPVIYVFIFNLEGAVTMSEWALVVNFCGVFAISCVVSAVIHVMVETPLLTVQRTALEKFGLWPRKPGAGHGHAQ